MSGRKPFHRNGATPEFNIALIGALGVGKSALTVKYITRRFIMEYDPDLEGTYTKHEDLDGQDIIVHIMDTCDKEDCDPSRYLKWADAFLIVYSITNRQTYDVAKEYMESISIYLKGQGRECPLALVGNKIDLERYRQVNKSEGASLATEYDSVFYETTATEEYELVEKVFHRLIQEAHHDKYGHIMQPVYIADDRQAHWGPQQQAQSQMTLQRRPKSPKGATDKKDEKIQQKKTLNKFFKIFN
ncbi:ras-like protein family member 12 [Physella acuta]|uniref:ras-like protein family member 12 n=1 Tax=Physella acuta TaxID=109671 RepID=UPI0027DDCF81|nr:ras-like protein family member 12 [Physella acuta]XP_059160123.1 ras-like protein family member 12 [Physella acuta]